MIILFALIFVAGVANFAMHRAMVESDDPIMKQALNRFQNTLGQHGLFIMEFLFLIAALSWATRSGAALLFYGGYTLMNGISLYLLMKRPR